jgi:hypothetical protein
MSQNQEIEKQFFASLIQFDAAAKTGTFYLMNTSRNRNGWGVTAKALDEALPTLKGKPLGMGKGYKPGHFKDAELMDSGKFTDYEGKGNYALGKAVIEDPQTVVMLQQGKLGPVSTVIHAYDVRCSKCLHQFKGTENPQEHECIKNGEAYEQIHSYAFKRFDFVDVPAYPQAGLMEMSAASNNSEVPLTLYASFYESQAVKTELGKEDKKMGENQEKRIAELENQLKQASDSLKTAETKAQTQETAISEFKAELEKIKKAEHDTLVNETFEARRQAGLAGKEDEEKTMLQAQVDSTLKILKSDALKTASILESTTKTQPKVTFTAQSQNELEAAIKEMRSTIGFPETKEA